MAEPKLTVLGVYHPQISSEAWQEQFDVTGDEAYTRDHFDKLVLFEAVAVYLHLYDPARPTLVAEQDTFADRVRLGLPAHTLRGTLLQHM